MKHLRLYLILALVPIGACQQEAPQAKERASSVLPGDTVEQGGLAAAYGRLVLPAVKGNPGAAYFRIFNGTEKPVSIVGVSIRGAGMAHMHRTQRDSMNALDEVIIKPTWTQRFIPGGRHVMAMDLDPKLKAGGKTEMILTFADGQTITVPLRIETVGTAVVEPEP